MRFELPPTADQSGQSDKKETQPPKEEELLKYEPGVGIRFTEPLKNESGETSEHQEGAEVNSAEIASEKIQSAENKVSELTTDGQQRISSVERDIDLPAEDIAAVREEVGLSGRLGKIRDEANGLLGRLKERFSGLLSKDKIPDTVIEKPENAERPEYDELKEYLKREQREISRPVIEEAKRKRDQLLEARGLLSMSQNDFDTHFSSKDFEVRVDLEQQNVGDCYAVAAIHAMSRSPHFEMICRSSMKKLPDGSWQVRVPLMSENGQMITITPEELLPQKNRQFLRRSEKSGIMPDLRRKLMPVKGKEGLQVLEAAFIKQKFGSVDRLAAEGGWGDEVLLSLGGDNFKKYSIDSAAYNEEKRKWEYPGLGSLDEKRMAYLDHYLENFDPEVHMATVSTKHGVGNVTGFYRVKGTVEFLVSGHAYSISGVDTEKNMVNLANPWDTSEPIELSFDQFKENFSAFNAIRIDSAKLLKSMKGVEKKAV